MPHKSKARLNPLNLSKESIGQRIARIRKERGFTQTELAEKIGIPHTLITDYERNKIRLYDEMVTRFALALGTSTDELLGLQNSEHIEPKLSLRVVKRIKQIEQLPESRKKVILRTLDDLIRANS